MAIEMIHTLNSAILWYFIILSLGYITLLLTSIPDIFTRFKEIEIGEISTLTKSHTMPPVTAIVSAYNEKHNILGSVYSLLKSHYPNLFVIVVNDGSTDNTLQILIDIFELHAVTIPLPSHVKSVGKVRKIYISKHHVNLIIIDKTHTDKSDSLNVALNLCRTPLFFTFDADNTIEPDAVSKIVFYTLTHPRVIAVGGAVYIRNGCQIKDGVITQAKMSLKPIVIIQACEYLRSFLFSRSGWNAFGGTLCYAGAFTLFDYQAVLNIGGFDVGNVAQDFEIITHLQSYAYKNKHHYSKIGYTPAAIVWTEVPDTMRAFWRQRLNWQDGTLRSLLRHKYICFNPKYGIIGMYTYPFFLFGETFGPVVEFCAYSLIIFSWYYGILDAKFAFLFFLICWGFFIFLTMATVLMSFITYNKYQNIKDLPRLLLLVALENFGFRQFHVACRVFATCKFFFNKLKFW
jgi:biofilm PGA synthesis N-glycosyltransferase PgaC